MLEKAEADLMQSALEDLARIEHDLDPDCTCNGCIEFEAYRGGLHG